MRVHPVISIILGVIASFSLHLLTQSLYQFGLVDLFIGILTYVIGGFIAVFFARERKIQYALYEGIVITLIIALMALAASADVTITIFYGVSIMVLALIGGIIGLMIDKNYRKSFKTKYLDKRFNLVSIIAGIIITFVIYLIIALITYHIILSTYTNAGLIYKTEMIAILIIGGFLATYIGKEKQLVNGIFVGFGIIFISIMGNVYFILIGHPLNLSSPLIPLIVTLGYILAPTLGSYIAIRVTK